MPLNNNPGYKYLLLCPPLHLLKYLVAFGHFSLPHQAQLPSYLRAPLPADGSLGGAGTEGHSRQGTSGRYSEQ